MCHVVKHSAKLCVALEVMVDLSLGAAGNASMHFEKMKKHQSKEQKTYEANEMAIKAAEKKVHVSFPCLEFPG